MPEPRRALLIANPRSRSGDGDLAPAMAVLREGAVEVMSKVPDNGAAIADLIRRSAEHVDCVILAGGDGTLNAAAGALREVGLPLGVLPTGTANDLARTLGIPLALERAAQVIVDGHRHRIDLGMVNDVHFFNVASIGLGTRVTRALSEDMKARWGVLGYPRAVLRALRTHRAFRARVVCDGRSRWLRTVQIAVGNGRHYGGGMTVAEHATIDNRRLELYAVRPYGFWHLLRIALALRTGDGAEALRGLAREQGRCIEVHTRRPREVSTDGEITTRTPARFEVLAGAVEVYVGAKAVEVEPGVGAADPRRA